MEVSVIIVNYKTPQLCINCINSVFEKTVGIDFEIILVDNDSQDDSLRIIKEEFGERVTLVDAKGNLGFGKANNLGAKYTKGEYLFLLNSDTILRNNAIKYLYDFIKQDSTVGIVGGNLFDNDGNPAHSFKYNQFDLSSLKVSGFFRTMWQKVSGKTQEWEFNDTKEPVELNGYITGADLMIKKSIFDEVGGFDSDFFMYFEESEMTFRVRQLGYKVYSVPEAEIIHLEGASTKGKSFSERRQRMFNESAVVYFRKVYGEESIVDCYKVMISNCSKVAFRNFLQFDFDATKKLRKEKKILKDELRNYK